MINGDWIEQWCWSLAFTLTAQTAFAFNIHIISLRELLNSKRILRYRSSIKEKANFWEEDLISENQDNITVTENIFDTRTQEIVESVLDENSTEVVTTIAWYVARS